VTEPVLKVFLKDGAKMPVYAHEGDSGLDLASTESLTLLPFRRYFVDTGVHVELPAGCEAHVRPRSGGNKKGLHIAYGTVDGPYRGPVGVVVYWMPNLTVRGDGVLTIDPNEPAVRFIESGDRIAQLVISQVVTVEPRQVSAQSELSDTTRGEQGWGSSGR